MFKRALRLLRKAGFDPNQPRVGEGNPDGGQWTGTGGGGGSQDSKGGRHDARDAFRHADWALRMTRNLGATKAKEFGDAHERSERGQPRENA